MYILFWFIFYVDETFEFKIVGLLICGVGGILELIMCNKSYYRIKDNTLENLRTHKVSEILKIIHHEENIHIKTVDKTYLSINKQELRHPNWEALKSKLKLE